MSIMQTLFGKTVPTNASTQVQSNPGANQPGTPGNIPATALNPADSSNPNAPQASTDAMTEQTPLSQLDQYTKLWENDPNVKAPADTSIFAKVTPESMQASAKKNDFMKTVTPEQMAAINAGGEGATAAMLTVMQNMAQKGFGDSAFTATKLIEQALEKQQQKFMDALPGIIKSQTVSENLRTSNPIFNHPAAQVILEPIKKQLMVKNPNASAAEIQEMANGYLESFAAAASPQKQTAAQKASANEMDWSQFLD